MTPGIGRSVALASSTFSSGTGPTRTRWVAPPGLAYRLAGYALVERRRNSRGARLSSIAVAGSTRGEGLGLALLRAAPVGTWAPVVPDALAVTPDRADQALRELASEGLVEVVVDGPGGPRARLAAS